MVIALRSLKSRQPQVQLYGGLISSFALLCGDCQLWRRRCCLRFSSPCLAFLCPQTRLALPFPLLHIGEHLKRFPLSLDTLYPHGFSKSERHSLRKCLPTQSLGPSELNELLLPSWSLFGMMVFIPHQAGGFVAATECMNRSRVKLNHVSHPRIMYVLRVVFLR